MRLLALACQPAEDRQAVCPVWEEHKLPDWAVRKRRDFQELRLLVFRQRVEATPPLWRARILRCLLMESRVDSCLQPLNRLALPEAMLLARHRRPEPVVQQFQNLRQEVPTQALGLRALPGRLALEVQERHQLDSQVQVQEAREFQVALPVLQVRVLPARVEDKVQQVRGLPELVAEELLPERPVLASRVRAEDKVQQVRGLPVEVREAVALPVVEQALVHQAEDLRGAVVDRAATLEVRSQLLVLRSSLQNPS